MPLVWHARIVTGFVLLVLVIAHFAMAAQSNQEARDATPALAPDAMRLLQRNCLSCHNAEKHKGGLELTSREALLEGGDSGPAFETKDPVGSRIVQVLAPDADPHMPPKKQLSTNQIDLVRRWVDAGAPWDAAALVRAAAPREVVFRKLPPGYEPVLALAVSPDGERLAVGRANRIVVYDLAQTNFPALLEREAHDDLVRALAWGSDGLLASGSFREVKVWSAEKLEPRWSMRTNLVGSITALSFTPGNNNLIAGESEHGFNGKIRVLATESGEEVAAWDAHSDSISALSVSPDGAQVASASVDGLTKVWDLATRKEATRVEGHNGAVFGVAFNTNATEVVTAGADRQLKVWDLATRQSAVSISGKKHAFNAVAWSRDGKFVAAVDDGGRLLSYAEFKRHSGAQSSDTGREKVLGTWTEPLHTVAISPDGERIFAGGQDGAVYVVNGKGKLLAKLAPGTASQPDVAANESSASDNAGEASNAPSRKESDPQKDAGFPVPSFVRDVLPAMAKAGCMAGSCHAKPEGQNGFKLSVFSYDPRADFAEIVKEARGRRVFPAAPSESLLLLKPTMAVEHGGGLRIEPGSETYALIEQWIRTGMIYQHTNEPALVRISVDPAERTYGKGASQQLRVTAHYADGSTRDVTALADYVANDKELAQVDETGAMRVGQVSGEAVVVARYMGFVDASRITIPADKTLPAGRYAKLPRNNFIDDLAYARFEKLGLFPSDLCTDAEFLRRSSLDAIGVLPNSEEARAFLADTNADKRARWIDRLLAHPAYGDYCANKWADLLRPNPDRVGVKSVFTLDQWLRESFHANKPYDQFVREILLTEGSNHRDGPAVIYRDRRDPPELTTMFSQLFLGTRMECAKCHHHPNEKWSQDDFYQFAAFFGPLKRKGAGLSPPISAGTETFYFATGGTVKHPVTEEVMAPRPPDAPPMELAPETDPRRELVRWLTRPENPFFARAAVNRVWANFFGRGFVEPVDDFRSSNPAVNEPLLAALAADFAKHGYDLKHLMRTILSSRLYQLSSLPNEYNLADTKNFSRSYRRRLPAEVLLDAVNDVTGVPDDFNGSPPGTRAIQTWSYKVRSQFMDAFGRPNSSSDCPCERDTRSSVVQSLHMMNSRGLQAKLAHADGRVKKLASSDLPPEKIVEELYLATLSRLPSEDELKTAVAAYSREKATRQTATEDVLWALLNSAEFVFNH